jgi:hypothetical protein
MRFENKFALATGGKATMVSPPPVAFCGGCPCAITGRDGAKLAAACDELGDGLATIQAALNDQANIVCTSEHFTSMSLNPV